MEDLEYQSYCGIYQYHKEKPLQNFGEPRNSPKLSLSKVYLTIRRRTRKEADGWEPRHPWPQRPMTNDEDLHHGRSGGDRRMSTQMKGPGNWQMSQWGVRDDSDTEGHQHRCRQDMLSKKRQCKDLPGKNDTWQAVPASTNFLLDIYMTTHFSRVKLRNSTKTKTELPNVERISTHSRMAEGESRKTVSGRLSLLSWAEKPTYGKESNLAPCPSPLFALPQRPSLSVQRKIG